MNEWRFCGIHAQWDLVSLKKEGKFAICNSMNNPARYYAKWNKPDRAFFYLHQVSKLVRLIETQNTRVAARDWKRRKWEFAFELIHNLRYVRWRSAMLAISFIRQLRDVSVNPGTFSQKGKALRPNYSWSEGHCRSAIAKVRESRWTSFKKRKCNPGL